MDARNSYRIVKKWSKNWERWNYSAQYRPWWWPFFTCISHHSDEQYAREACHRHASAWDINRRSKRSVTKLGKLP